MCGGGLMKDLTSILSREKNELLYGDTEKDIEELYEKLIKLPSKEIQKLFNMVIDFKTNANKQEEEKIENRTL